MEFAGEIVETGGNVKNFAIGDRVFGITAGGAHADFILTDKRLLVEIPHNLSFTEAAAIPEAFITAHDAIFTIAGLKKGETLLIHAVGSGVGLAALQLAKAKGVRVFGTSRTHRKLKLAETLGLDEPILADENFSVAILEKTEGKGINVILDLVGAKYFPGNLQSLANKGRMVLVGLTGGVKTEFNLGIALSKRLQITGTVLRSRSTREKAAATAKFARQVIPLLQTGKLKATIDRTFKLEEIRSAHEYLEANKNFGKIVLEF